MLTPDKNLSKQQKKKVYWLSIFQSFIGRRGAWKWMDDDDENMFRIHQFSAASQSTYSTTSVLSCCCKSLEQNVNFLDKGLLFFELDPPLSAIFKWSTSPRSGFVTVYRYEFRETRQWNTEIFAFVENFKIKARDSFPKSNW